MNEKIYLYHTSTFENNEVENEFEDLDPYFRIYIFKHLGKTPKCAKVFS